MAKSISLQRVVLISLSVIIVVAWLATFFNRYIPYGCQFEVVMSGSMEPSLKTGSLMLIRSVNPREYKVGDIVSFHPPLPNKISVTHRITKLYFSDDGVPEMATKGDANTNGDPWVTSLGAIEGKKILAVPWIGYGILFLQTPYGFLGVALLTFLGVVAAELAFIGMILRTAWNDWLSKFTAAKKV